MRKRENTVNASLMLTGLSYGEHVMNADRVVDDLKETLKNCGNSFIVRCQPYAPMDREMYLTIARFAKESGMPFGFLYATQHPPQGKLTHFDKETLDEIEKIAGDLFLGEMFGEIGSEKAAKDVDYFTGVQKRPSKPLATVSNMAEARAEFVREIREMMSQNEKMGLKKSLVVEATALMAYLLEGGIGIPVLEVLPGNPEKLIAFTRGAAISYKRPMWGGFIAHEWYGGYRHEDELKKKRLELTYKHLYMQGSNIAYLESGNTELLSYGKEYGYDSELCKNYRRVIEEFHSFAKENPRPACGPLTKLAFVLGEDDGYTDFMGGAVWEQFGREEWGKGDPERSWNLLSEVYRSPDWHDPLSFDGAGLDLGHAPAYGTYDVIAACAPLEVMKNYSYLIFVGHNTMSRALYGKLTEYVRAGGTLLMSVAHLSENPSRGAKDSYVCGGDLAELFGCKITGSVRKCHGVKFFDESDIPALKYPGTPNRVCDPIFTEGYLDYATLELGSAKMKAELYSGFASQYSTGIPAVIENSLGKGHAILTTHLDYPGNPGVYPIYRILMKGLLTASHALCDLKVTGSDKVRFSFFYDEDGTEKLYLLNTGYDDDACVTVRYGEKVLKEKLAPTELRIINI